MEKWLPSLLNLGIQATDTSKWVAWLIKTLLLGRNKEETIFLISNELQLLKERYERIERQLIHKLSEMENIQGTIRISVNGKRIRYYHHWDGYEDKECYISKKDIDLARAVAQKNYYDKLLNLVQKRLKEMKRLLMDFDELEIDYLYDKLLPSRKELISPIEKTIQQRFEEWLQSEYQGKEFREGVPMILTEKGERVRSKSEKIIADYLYRNKIEYKYEKPLFLKGIGTIYPDFTFFSRKIGQEIYWEHDGRMDDGDYARKAVHKIEVYESNGIYIGERLIVTFETSEKILGTKEIERIVHRFLA